MINNYIKNDKEFLEKKHILGRIESSANGTLKQRFNILLGIKYKAIETEYELKNSYYKNLLYDQVISKKNYREIELNKNLNQLQVNTLYKEIENNMLVSPFHHLRSKHNSNYLR